jgi:hypothetical protein
MFKVTGYQGIVETKHNWNSSKEDIVCQVLLVSVTRQCEILYVLKSMEKRIRITEPGVIS